MQLDPITPRAATAIIAQIDSNADTGGGDFYATVDGQELEFTAKFTVDWDWFSDYPGDPVYWSGTCRMIGAWAFDPDTDEVLFAGNRAEAVALIGERAVEAWEQSQSEREE